MKAFYWILLFFSAVLYALPFLFTYYLWWLIFFFPIPLLYLVCTENLLFIHGYIWGVTTFILHVSGGIYVIALMAHESWLVGLLLGVIIVLYQALSVALFFCGATKIAQYCAITSPIVRLFLWTFTLGLFITWTDSYSLWIFGIKEGYPLMHPLIPLAQHPQLLFLLPIFGKPLLTILFLLFSVSATALLWLQNCNALFLFIAVSMPWLLCWHYGGQQAFKPQWLNHIKSVPFMVHFAGDNSIAMMKAVGNELEKIITQYPGTTIIIMPESAINCTNREKSSELFQLLNEQYIGKAVHFIFGSFRYDKKGNYYNTAYWIYNGDLQQCFDKRHAVLVSERLSWLSSFPLLKNIYCSTVHSTTISVNERVLFDFSQGCRCVPYICSELFFNEYPDDCYPQIPIVALVNDTEFLQSYAWYIRDILVLIARMKAILWKRDIVYVSYSNSLFINKKGQLYELNE